MLAALADKKVPLKRRSFAASKVPNITPALTALLAKSDELKVTAQAAFASYVRSVFLHPRKAIFDVSKLDLEAFAGSLGLPTMPRVRTVQKLQKQAARSAAKAGQKASGTEGATMPSDPTARARTDHDRRGDDSEDGVAEDVGVADRSRGPASSREHAAPTGGRADSGESASGSDSEQDDVLTMKRSDVLDARGADAGGCARQQCCLQCTCGT